MDKDEVDLAFAILSNKMGVAGVRALVNKDGSIAIVVVKGVPQVASVLKMFQDNKATILSAEGI